MLEPNSQKRIKKTPKGPRVMIGLDVQDDGAMPKKELPFVLGVLANVSGNLPNRIPFRNRKALQVDRENFSAVMAHFEPKVKIEGMTDPLTFKTIEDFEPEAVARQIPELRRLLEIRQELTDLRSRLESNGDLKAGLEDVLANHEQKARILASAVKR